ncbi:MAG: porin [Planctomycetota bacterium]
MRHAGVCLCLVTLLTVSTAFADGDAAESAPEPSLEELLERVERLEQDKAEMADEIDELRAQVGDDWLTERRSDEIRSLVADVLADADTRASLLQDGMTAGWDEHFFLASPDGRFRLQLDGLMQVRWIWNYHDQPDDYISGWENARTKVTFRGHVFSPDITYLIRSDFARSGGSDTLQDAWVRYHLNDQLSVRVGQFKLPFNREELVGPMYLQAIERSLVNESLNIGRSQGIEMTYADRSNRFTLSTSDGGEDNFGNFNLTGSNPVNSPWNGANSEWAFAARYEQLVAGRWDQFTQFTSPPGDPFGLMWGIAGHVQRSEYTGLPSLGRNEEYWFGLAGDVSAEFGGANLFGSIVYQYIDDPSFGIFNVYGVVVQGGTYFTEKLEAFARFEYGHVDSDFDFEDLWLLTVGANYYIDGQDLKLSADVGFGLNEVSAAWDSDLAGWRLDGPGSDPQVVFRTQFQLLF